MSYSPRTFNLPTLDGISNEAVKIHLALYEGYVKHTNLIIDKIAKLKEEDAEGNAYITQELRRRLGFEFDGMRMHEYYFEQLEGGAEAAADDTPLADAAKQKYGSWDGFIEHIKEVAGTRGNGWVIVYYDPKEHTLHTCFVNDHQIGQLAGLPVILGIDLWEHAYMVDYVPSKKNEYVEAFLRNINWGVVDKRFMATR